MEDYKSKFINKPEEERSNHWKTKRNGPIGTVKLNFQKRLTRFVDKENDHNHAPIEMIFETIADVQKRQKV